MQNTEERQVESVKDMENAEQKQVELSNDMENMEENCEMIRKIWKKIQ